MKIAFIIPVYNEEDNIATLLESIRYKMKEMANPYTILLVNDGSVDKTTEIAGGYKQNMPIYIINHLYNKGVGEVFRTGFNSILNISHDCDVVVSMEADNTSDLDILPLMIDRVRDGYDLVLASCYAKGGMVKGTTFTRKLMSNCANYLLRRLFPIPNVRTYSSFYRVHSINLIKKANLVYGQELFKENGFACMVEFLVKLSWLGARVAEVPMVLRCHFRKGNSKMKIIITIIGYLQLFRRLRTIRNRRVLTV